MAQDSADTSTSPLQVTDEQLQAWVDHVRRIAIDEGLPVDDGSLPTPDELRRRLADEGYTTLPMPDDLDDEVVGAAGGDAPSADVADRPRDSGARRRKAEKILRAILRGKL
jgi:hypothetical protein